MEYRNVRSGIDPAQLEPLCSLDDPTRRRLYDHVAGRAEPVTRDEAAAALDLERSTVAYHLDRLVGEGLLTASFARPAGRGGPGAGRPAKRYERSGAEFAVSIPPRDYELAAELLARAADADTAGAVREALDHAAQQYGCELAANDEGPENFVDHLARQGFEPYQDEETIRLRNCPFHGLARRHTELVCNMNLSMLRALSQAVGAPFEAQLAPAPERCCVAFVPKA